jgi:hypothetical protein
MGLAAHDLWPVSATTYRTSSSSEEGDTAYIPRPIRNKLDDLPTIVIKASVLESLHRLRVDAKWWLNHPSHQTNVVIIISLKITTMEVRIETWERALVQSSRSTRQNPGNPLLQVPTLIHDIFIDSNYVTGAPLRLEFQKIMLRPAVPPESDFEFTLQDLFLCDLFISLRYKFNRIRI